MLDRVKNLLYRNPELYELVYPEPHEETPEMCRRMFTRFLSPLPASILDIGCGTGRDLAALARECGDCDGVDALPTMIELARLRYPQIRWEIADMRQLRLTTFQQVGHLERLIDFGLSVANRNVPPPGERF